MQNSKFGLGSGLETVIRVGHSSVIPQQGSSDKAHPRSSWEAELLGPGQGRTCKGLRPGVDVAQLQCSTGGGKR